MTYLTSIILGIIQGFTEFLPVSSTAHLILVSTLLKISQSDFQKMFEVVIQLGSILAVIALYWRKLFSLNLCKRLLVAFIPTGIIGLLLHKVIKNLYDQNQIIIITLMVGGLIIILFEFWHQEKESDIDELNQITYKQSLFLGLFQSLAIMPGVSRSAATIIGGLSMGIKRRTIVEFSFLLAVPTMFAASGLDLVTGYKFLGEGNFGLLVVGFMTSFVVSVASIKFLLGFIRRFNFVSFGIYRILAAIFFWLVIL